MITLWQILPESIFINIVSLGVNGDVIANRAVFDVGIVLADHGFGLVCHESIRIGGCVRYRKVFSTNLPN